MCFENNDYYGYLLVTDITKLYIESVVKVLNNYDQPLFFYHNWQLYYEHSETL